MGDVFGNGRNCLVTGNFFTNKEIPIEAAISIWSTPVAAGPSAGN